MTVLKQTGNGRIVLFALGLLILIWTVALNLPPRTESAGLVDEVEYDQDLSEGQLVSSLSPSTTSKPIPFLGSAFVAPTSTTRVSKPKITEPAVKDRPLILYSYFESENARANFRYYLDHALHDAADFLFLINGPTDAEKMLPNKGNIRFIKRPNDCYDLGGFAEMLLTNDLYKNYQRFIMMNASVRGPFFPIWSTDCWSDVYLNRLTNHTKLIGMTMNCQGTTPHVQSMLWALDRVGLEVLLNPSDELVAEYQATVPKGGPGAKIPDLERPGINSCPHSYWEAVSVEVHATWLMRTAGYDVEAMMYSYRGFGEPLSRGEVIDLGGGPVKHGTYREGTRYEDICAESLDPLYENHYWGMTIHPWDTIFTKQNRPVNQVTIERLSQWGDGIQYSSYDHCQ